MSDFELCLGSFGALCKISYVKIFKGQLLELEILKCYSYSFHLISTNRYEDIGYHREYRLLLFLAIGQVLKILWYFESLKWETMEKSSTYNILKRADQSVKQMNIWDSHSYVLHT